MRLLQGFATVLITISTSIPAMAQSWSPGPWSVTVTMNNELESVYREGAHISSSATSIKHERNHHLYQRLHDGGGGDDLG